MSVDSSLIFLLGIAAAAGAALWRLGSLEARTKELEAFRARAGERIGRLENDTRHLRKLTGAHGVPIPAGGGQVAGPVDDESS
jgi:hypothetical protein